MHKRYWAAAPLLALMACVSQSEAPQDEAEADAIVVTAMRADEAKRERGGNYLAAPAPMVGYAPSQTMMAPPYQNTEQYEETDPNPVKLTTEEPVSTFSSDVDTPAYSVMRRYISADNMLPPSDSVRVEEYVNYFDYDYAKPKSADAPFAPTVWVTPSPWNAGTRLMHIGVKGFDLQPAETPDANIVFLLDVSGSMEAENKLPLVKKSVELLIY